MTRQLDAIREKFMHVLNRYDSFIGQLEFYQQVHLLDELVEAAEIVRASSDRLREALAALRELIESRDAYDERRGYVTSKQADALWLRLMRADRRARAVAENDAGSSAHDAPSLIDGPFIEGVDAEPYE